MNKHVNEYITELTEAFTIIIIIINIIIINIIHDRLGGLVVRVLGYRSGSPGSISRTTKQKKK
jgi:hypothetical protein